MVFSIALRTSARRAAVMTASRRTFTRATSAVRAEDAGDAATRISLDFSMPHASVYSKAECDMVIIPGTAGEYGVTAGHTPVISELRPGVVQIFHNGVSDPEPEKFFISGGFAMTHANSNTVISTPEAVKVEDLDAEAAQKGYNDAKAAMDAAEPESEARARAQISFEAHEAMCQALGLAVA